MESEHCKIKDLNMKNSSGGGGGDRIKVTIDDYSH